MPANRAASDTSIEFTVCTCYKLNVYWRTSEDRLRHASIACAKRHAFDERSVERWKRKRKMKAHECGHSNSPSLSLHQQQEVTSIFIGSALPGMEPTSTFTTGYAAAFHKRCSAGPWLRRTRRCEDVRIRMGGCEDVMVRRWGYGDTRIWEYERVWGQDEDVTMWEWGWKYVMMCEYEEKDVKDVRTWG